MLSHGVFLLVQLVLLVSFFKDTLKEKKRILRRVYNYFTYGAVTAFVLLVLVLTYKDKIRFGNRILSLLDPSYAAKFNPLVESISEHNPTSWASIFYDVHFLLGFAPLGFFFCYRKPTNARLFISFYTVTSTYFASAMVRLVLLSSPALCFLSAVGISDILDFGAKQFKLNNEEYNEKGYLIVEEDIQENKKENEGSETPQGGNVKILFYRK